MSNIVVTGSGDGLGRAICETLSARGESVIGLTLSSREKPTSFVECDGVDVTNVQHVKDAAKDCFACWQDKHVDTIINCAGINRIGYLELFDERDWDAVMDTNAKGIFLMAKYFLPRLVETRGTILNIVSNASHMPMTCSAAYNASKGAAHILTLQLARELTRRWGITVFGISPNKLAGTGMSKDIDDQVCSSRGWTPEYAKAYQLGNLLAGEETDPMILAEFIGYLLAYKDRHKFLTGCIIPYGA